VTDLGDARLEELRRRYLADHVRTATPGQRLLMLYDRLLDDLRGAQAAFGTMDRKAINDALVHGQHVLFALRDTLDTTVEIGRSLQGIYNFCLGQLLAANMEKDESLLPACIEILEKLRDANRQAVAAATQEAATQRAVTQEAAVVG